MKLLVISNGHGEDIIAIKIIEQLRKIDSSLEISALPMVGKGFAYTQAQIDIVTEVQTMPSGGFIYMDKKQLWGDLRHGLLGLTIKQYQAVKQWSQNGGIILAVGDILPLLLAWVSGVNYFFVGTAKSEYYLRDENDWLKNISWLERLWGSYYYPWEYWLMKNPRCLGVFPRDSITTAVLQKANVPAYDLGNPMIDDLANLLSFPNEPSWLKVLLLPGSRIPEAIHNWQLILQGVDSIIDVYDEDFICIAAIAPSLSLDYFQDSLLTSDWLPQVAELCPKILDDSHVLYFRKENAQLLISQKAYSQALNYCDVALAMAGTATEQFVGLGKPAIAFPGNGPQYNRQFADNQKRLLGISLQLLENPAEVGEKLKQLLSNTELLKQITVNGKKRLGEVGASLRIAQFISNQRK
jgi:uncharacterized protein (TIGR03492 family)